MSDKIPGQKGGTLRQGKAHGRGRYSEERGAPAAQASATGAAARCFGDTAVLLVRDAVRTRQNPGALPAYRDDLVRDVVLEVKHLFQQLSRYQTSMAALAVEADLAASGAGGIAGVRAHRASMAAVPLATASAMHTLALRRNKRCVLSYQRNRLDCIMRLLWSSSGGASTAARLPTTAQQNMSAHELDFAASYKALASAFRGHVLDIDLGGAGGTGFGGGISGGAASNTISGIVPPKDVFVEIRVIRDCGDIMTEAGALHLSPGSQHYLRRSDVEDLILSGHVVDLGFTCPPQ